MQVVERAVILSAEPVIDTGDLTLALSQTTLKAV